MNRLSQMRTGSINCLFNLRGIYRDKKGGKFAVSYPLKYLGHEPFFVFSG